MPPLQARTTDIAALAFEYGDRLVLGTVREVHRVVADRAFAPARAVGGRPAERVHDAVSGAVYGSISGTLHAASAGARAASPTGGC